MRVEIEAALVGGAAAGLTAVGAVLLTQFINNRASNRRDLQAAVLKLNRVHSAAVVYMSAQPPDPRGVNYDSPGYALNQEVDALLNEIALLAKRGRGPRKRRLRTEVDDVIAKTAAAHMRWHDGHRLSTRDMLELATDEITELVLGRRSPLDVPIVKYYEEGFISSGGNRGSDLPPDRKGRHVPPG